MARSPSRHRSKLEPITISELEADPTMVGFTSLFRIPTTEMPLSHLLPPGTLPPTLPGDPMPGELPLESERFDAAPPATTEAHFTPAPTVGAGITPTVGAELPLSPAILTAPLPPLVSDAASPLPSSVDVAVDVAVKMAPEGAADAVPEITVASIAPEQSAPTVGSDPKPTVRMSSVAAVTAHPKPTVGSAPTPAVAREPQQRHDRPVPVRTPSFVPTPGPGSTPTVGSGSTPPDPPATAIWQTEAGEIFTAKRARRIQRAQDALTHAEETVYDALWGTRTAGTDRERLVRIGYDRLAALARVNEKSARLIIPRLIEKGFVEIHAPADPNRRLGTEYRVFSYGAVLDNQRRRGRQWVLRSGNGVFYVRPVASLTAVVAGSVTDGSVTDGSEPGPTVGVEVSKPLPPPAPTVGAGPTVTVGRQPTDTVGAGPTDTVGAAPTVSLGRELGNHRQSPSSAVYLALSRYAVADDDAVKALIARCRMQAPDATEDEMAACIEEKGKVIATGRIDNPIAFLLVYVPKCFAGDWLREYRQARWALAQAELEREREAREWDARERARLTAVLEDPDAPAEDREWARQYLGLSR